MNASVITSWRLSQLIQSRPLVVFTRNTAEAQRWQEEIAWFRPDAQLCCLPDWETLAYDRFSPHQDLVSERLATLWLISQGEFDILLVPVTTALYRLPPVSYLAGHTFFLRQGQKLEGDTLIRQMAQAGYQAVQQVIRPGEFCRRGGVLDLFPMGSTLPYRLELFDDRLETLRTFDADTQRSLYPVPELRLLPAREFPLDEAARTRFRSNFRDHFEGDPSRCTLYRDVGNGLSPGGIEYYLPLFFDQCASLFDYLPASSRVFTPADLTIPIREFLTSVRSRWEMVSGDRTYPVLPPDALFLREEAFFVGLKAFVPERPPYDTHSLPALDIQRRSPHPLAKLQQFIDEFPGRILILSDSLGRRETLRQLLNEQGIAPEITQHWAQFETSTARLMLTVAPLQEGLLYHDRLALITENELFQTQVHQRRRRDRRSQSDNLLRDLTEVHIGDPVVHQDHGIGRFMGLVTLDLGEAAVNSCNSPMPEMTPSTCQSLSYTLSAAIPVALRNLLLSTNWAVANGKRPAVRRLAKHAILPPNYWTCTHGAPHAVAGHVPLMTKLMPPSPRDFLLKKPPTNWPPSMPFVKIWLPPNPWIVWSAAMWASAKPKSRCVLPF